MESFRYKHESGVRLTLCIPRIKQRYWIYVILLCAGDEIQTPSDLTFTPLPDTLSQEEPEPEAEVEVEIPAVEADSEADAAGDAAEIQAEEEEEEESDEDEVSARHLP